MELTITSQARYSRLTIIVVLIAAVAIIGGWSMYTQPGVLGKADAVGYAICHRIQARSFEAFGRPLPLCARCTGIYLGVMTGLGVFIASGRSKAGQFASWRVNSVLGLFVVIMGIDGVNSYFHLFPGFKGIYEPSNTLRVITGTFCGLTLINMVFPIFNQSIWENCGDAAPPIRNLKELAGLAILAGLMVLLVMSQNATILLFLGLVSALGVVIILTMIMTVIFVTATNTFRCFQRWQELWFPMVGGLTMAVALIFAINIARYTFTGTWEGFVF